MSKKNIITFFFLICIAILLFFPLAKALQEDFDVFLEKKDISACSCGVTAEDITIKNTGDVPASYTLSKKGSAAAYVTIAEGKFHLESGESKKLSTFINTPCTGETIKEWTLDVQTLFGLKKEITQTISSHRCPNVELIPLSSIVQQCPGTPLSYDVLIKNNGAITETYALSITKYAQYASITQPLLVLSSGQSKTVTIYLNLPPENYGIIQFELQALTSQTKLLAKIPLEARIDRCYDFSLLTQGKTVCNGEKNSLSLSLTNLAPVTNGLTLSSSSNNIISSSQEYILFPKETIITNVTIDATHQSPSIHNVSIRATSSRGNFAKEQDVPITIEKCHALSTHAVLPEFSVNCENNTFFINLENEGTKKEDILITSESDKLLINQKNITISPGEKKQTSIAVNVPCDKTDELIFDTTIKTSNNIFEKKIQFITPIIEQSKAYLLDIGPQSSKRSYYKNEQISIPITHKGKKEATYTIAIAGPSWVSTSNPQILSPGQTKELILTINPSNETLEETYPFSVSLTVSNTHLSYTRNFEVTLSKKTLSEKINSFLKDNWKYFMIFFAIILLLFLIPKIKSYLKERKKEKSSKIRDVLIKEESLKLLIDRNWKKKDSLMLKILGILLLLLILLGAGIAGLILFKQYEKTILDTEKPTLIEIPEDTEISQDGMYNIPVTIHNPTDIPIKYIISLDKKVPWIFSDTNKLLIDEKGKETFHILVNVSRQVSDGTYAVTIFAKTEMDKKVIAKDATIHLKRSQKKEYLPFIIAGLILLIILILTSGFIKKKSEKKLKEEIITKIGDSEKKSYRGIWIFLLAIILIIFLIVGLFVITEMQKKTKTPKDFSEEILIKNDTTNNGVAINLTQGQELILPVIFTNTFNDKAVYLIKTDQTWIYIPEKTMTLESGKTKEVNVTFSPMTNVSDGYYELTILGIPKNQDITFTKTISLYVKNKNITTRFGDFLRKFWAIVSLIILIIFFLALFTTIQKKDVKKSVIIQQIKDEISLERKKTKTK